MDTSRVILDITQNPRSVWTGLPPDKGYVKTEKSCRNDPKIKHVQYKCTMCFKTFILFLFYIFEIAHFQSELFQYSISASWVRTLAVVNFVFGWRSVADPGSDFRRGVDFVNWWGGGGGVENQWKCGRLKKKSFLACFSYISKKLCLKLIASVASEEKFEKYYRFGHTKIIGPRPLGGGGRRWQR